MLDAVYANKKQGEGAAYYYMRALVEQLARELGYSLKFKAIKEPLNFPLTAPFDQSRSALVETIDGDFLGIIGELKTAVQQAFKLPQHTAAMSLDLEGLQKASEVGAQPYTPLSRFPSTTQDISLRTAKDTTYEEAFRAVSTALTDQADGIKVKIEPVSIYQASADDDTKTTTFHITFTHDEKTLRDEDIKPLMDHVASVALRDLLAERI